MNSLKEAFKEYDKINPIYFKESTEEKERKRPFDENELDHLEKEVSVEIKYQKIIKSELLRIQVTEDDPEHLVENFKLNADILADRLINDSNTLLLILNLRPSLLFNDYVIKLVIQKLQSIMNPSMNVSYDYISSTQSKNAKKILEQLGLKLFIPKNYPKTNLSAGVLYHWRFNPSLFYILFARTKGALCSHTKKKRKIPLSGARWLYKKLFNKKISKYLEKQFTAGSTMSINDITLCIICDQHKLSLEAVKKFWQKEFPKSWRRELTTKKYPEL